MKTFSRANRPPTPGISPKNKDNFPIFSYEETVDKNQFYVSQIALKLTCSNVELKFSWGDIPGPHFKASGRGGKGQGNEQRDNGREGIGRSGDRRPTSSCFKLTLLALTAKTCYIYYIYLNLTVQFMVCCILYGNWRSISLSILSKIKIISLVSYVIVSCRPAFVVTCFFLDLNKRWSGNFCLALPMAATDISPVWRSVWEIVKK